MPDKPELAETEKQNHTHRAGDYFLLDCKRLDFLVEACSKLAGPARDAADVFVSNLMAALATAFAVPAFAFQTARQGTEMIMLGVAVATDRLRQPGEGENERRERIWKSIEKDLTTLPWKERAEEVTKQMSDGNLSKFLAHPRGRDAADHVLRQCTVLTWSAFEVLASDLFLLLVNANPKLSGLLLKDERTKKLYQAKEFVVALEDHEYDLSRHMGEVLLKQSRMDDLNTIRAAYAVLFKDREGLRDALGSDRLWRLYKTRNLIVHRAGTVDELFLKTTGLTAGVGSRLKITPRELEDFILMVGHIGEELLAAVSTVAAHNPAAMSKHENG